MDLNNRVRTGVGIFVATLCIVLSLQGQKKPALATATADCNTPAAGQFCLDILFQGPFTLEKTNTGMLMAAPIVTDTHTPPQIGFGPSIQEIKSGDYSLDFQPVNAGKGQFVHPVVGTATLSFNGSGPQMDSKQKYFSISLPMPEQIVDWNADPAAVGNAEPVPSDVQVQRYPSLYVLRYLVNTNSFTITLTNKVTGKQLTPAFVRAGAQGLVEVAQAQLTPSSPSGGHDPAKESFRKMAQMYQLDYYADFPTIANNAYGTNIPLIDGVLPSELLTVLQSTQIAQLAPSAQKARRSSRLVFPLGLNNDCKAPQIVIDRTQ